MAKKQSDPKGTAQRTGGRKAAGTEIADTPRFIDVTEQRRLNEAREGRYSLEEVGTLPE